jgi:hypothetical protein
VDQRRLSLLEHLPFITITITITIYLCRPFIPGKTVAYIRPPSVEHGKNKGAENRLRVFKKPT